MKKIQIVSFIVSLILLTSHKPVFSMVSSIPADKTNGFFQKNQQGPCHIGVKGWVRGIVEPIYADNGSMDAGLLFGRSWETAIGSFIEWHFVNGMGLQTGLYYSYIGRIPYGAPLHALSCPLYLRIWIHSRLDGDRAYRQFVIFGGGRFIVARHIVPNHFCKKTEKILGVGGASNRLRYILDVGFEYNFKNGWIIGISPVGVALGYNFMGINK